MRTVNLALLSSLGTFYYYWYFKYYIIHRQRFTKENWSRTALRRNCTWWKSTCFIPMVISAKAVSSSAYLERIRIRMQYKHSMVSSTTSSYRLKTNCKPENVNLKTPKYTHTHTHVSMAKALIQVSSVRFDSACVYFACFTRPLPRSRYARIQNLYGFVPCLLAFEHNYCLRLKIGRNELVSWVKLKCTRLWNSAVNCVYTWLSIW